MRRVAAGLLATLVFGVWIRWRLAGVPIHSALTLFPEDFAARVTKRVVRTKIPVAAAPVDEAEVGHGATVSALAAVTASTSVVVNS